MRLFRILLFLVVSLATLAGAPAHALDVNTPVAAYRRDVYDARAGAPRNAFAMAQTVSGWLWFGTPSGLYRYDGVRFEAFQPVPGERLLGQYITALLAHPDGDLWIGYLYGGVSVLHEGHLRHLEAPPGKPVSSTSSFAVDGADVWVSASSGLFRHRGGRWRRFGKEDGFTDSPARFVYRDSAGRIWAADAGAVYVLDRAAGCFDRVFASAGDQVIVGSPEGRAWVADGTTVQPLPAPPGGWRRAAPAPVRSSAQQFLFDRDGNYWSGNCPDGICVVRPAHQRPSHGGFPDVTATGARHDGRIGRASVTVTSLLEDREGNLWTATTAGVERLRDTRLVPLVLPPASGWPSMALDAGDTAWIVSTNMMATGRLWKVEAGVPVEQHTGQVNSLVAQGRGGTVLVAGEHWIERRLGSRILARYPMPASARGQPARDIALLLAEDRHGIWLYQGSRGLLRWRDGAWTAPSMEAGLARAIYACVDEAGNTWFGTRDNRVVMVDGDRRTEYGAADGVALGAVTFVHAGRERVISGDNGSAVWRGKRFSPLHADGVDLANISGLVATADGDRWLNTRRGLFHVKVLDWKRSMEDPALPLRGTLLDELDGFPGAGHGISPVPTLRLDGKGRLWASGTDGVAVLDRARLLRNAAAPCAEILALVADALQYRVGVPATLAPGTERLRFDFTAPSLAMPERVRFRYRLAGFDHGWLDAGTTRSASYTNLAPAEYRFEVQAINEDGVSGPVAASTFRIEPTTFQTRWFGALCAAALCLAAWLLYRWRLRGMQRAWQLRMDERIAERERIARTLHDTFLQSLQGLIFHLDAVAARLLPASKEQLQVEEMLHVARKVTQEGRSQVLDLRAETVHADLADALAAGVDELRTHQDVLVSIRQTGNPRPLAPASRQEIEAIAREAIANVFRHAKASRLDIALDWSGRGLVLSIADDGIGVHPSLLARGRPGHWGVRGMRERAARIGASISVRNRIEGGVEVRLETGGGAGYGVAAGPWGRAVQWFRKMLP